jgi:hypothetical protein
MEDFMGKWILSGCAVPGFGSQCGTIPGQGKTFVAQTMDLQ